MSPRSKCWKTITRSEFQWEQDALDYIRERLPDEDPYRAWSNFEFMGQDGSINEVDLAVLTPRGFFLVEIKSWSGRVRGDAGTWEWIRDGRSRFFDNPLLLTNRKAKKLRSLLACQKASKRDGVPYIEPVVFLSAADVQCELDYAVRSAVFLRDRPARGDKPARRGIMTALLEVSVDPRRPRFDRNTARALTRAMDEAGIRPSRKTRQVGDHRLEKLLSEGPTYQDWEAVHVALEDVRQRVRIYAVHQASSGSERATIERAARREYQILQGIEHPGILRAQGFTENERGPALIFDHDPDAWRLDHFLKEHGDTLGVEQRLDLVRQLAEALQFAHEKKLFHRALSPQSVFVSTADDGRLRLRIFNWQTASRVIASTGGGDGRTYTRHLDRLVDEAVEIYLAPESLAAADTPGESFDVFGLGALAFTLFSGQPPAASVQDRLEHLREHQGLDIGTVLDGAGPYMRDLILEATRPAVPSRLNCVADFCELLDAVEDELTRPEVDFALDPTSANRGAILEGGFRVVRRLGTGSTAVAYLVENDGRESVLKLALEPRLNDRIADEATVLAQLRHHLIVELRDTVHIQGHAGLLLAHAGEDTLGDRIKRDAPFSLDLLERFGSDLLSAVTWLEEKGVAHRDIKPENIGVTGVTQKEKLHLVLFDFSLSRAPADAIRVGTHSYLDPFLPLRKPCRWDQAAERYSVALVLHEMATGTLPIFGDGQSDPALIDDEATIEERLFDVSVREPLTAFFLQALQRAPRRRFDNAEDMLRAWRRVFDAAATRPHEDRQPDRAAFEAALATATRDTSLSELGISSQALNALEREGLARINELLGVPVARLVSLRGVSEATRRELLELVKRLDERFPEVVVAEDTTPEPTASLDRLAAELLPSGSGRATDTDRHVLSLLFGLTALPGEAGERPWPAQADVAAVADVTAARVSQALVRVRKRLSSNASLAALRDEVQELLAAAGAVMTTDEIATAVAMSRGSAATTDVRTARARAVVRAAIEVEGLTSEPRWIVRRGRRRVLVCLERVEDVAVGGQALADWAERLGRTADVLARCDPLTAPARAVEELAQLARPAGLPALAPARCVRLAVEASTEAALSSRGEIYPVGMAAERALALSLGALLGAETLTVAQVHGRVRSRYPRAAPLPDRPNLDTWLQEAGLGFTWDPDADEGRGAYRAPRSRGLLLSSGTTSLRRLPTADQRVVTASPEAAQARAFATRLARAAEHGSFLVLTVHPTRAAAAERQLARLPLAPLSVEAVLLDALRAEAAAREIDWSVVLEADAAPAGSEDRGHLRQLARLAVKRLEGAVAEAARERTVLLTRPGLLARYNSVDCLERLRDRVGARATGDGPPLHGLWVLVPSEDQHAGPVLDHVAIPIITPGQWVKIPDAWLENRHNGRAAAAPEKEAP